MVANVVERLQDVLGWRSPIGLGIFLIAIGILLRLMASAKRKKE